MASALSTQRESYAKALDWQLLLVFLLAVSLAWLITYSVREIARRRHLLAHPNERSSHTIPTPRLGGIGIVIAFLLVMLAYVWWQSAWATAHWSELSGLLLGGALMAGLGLWDDLYTLSPRFKLVGQVLIALVPVLFGLRLHGIVFPTAVSSFLPNYQVFFGPLEIPLTLIWIVAMVNLFNFMDGIDGLVAGVVVIASTFFVGLVLPVETAWLVVPLVVLSGACLGFLRFNANPASIFMGDSGSLFLGFMIATLAIIYAPGDITTTSLLAPILLLSALLFDAIYTLVRRLLQEEDIFKAHRSHLYQRLVIVGFRHRRVSEYYYGLSLIAGVSAVTYFYSTSVWGQWAAVVICLGAFLFTVWLVNQLEKKQGQVVIIRNRYYFILDLLLIPAIAVMSFLIWVNTVTLQLFLPQMRLFIILTLIIKPLVFYLMGFYRRLWRYASIGEMVLIVNGAAVTTLVCSLSIIILGMIFKVPAAQEFPRSVIAFDFLLTIAALGGLRFYSRLVTLRWSLWLKPISERQKIKQVLIMGAGDEGATIARELVNNPAQRVIPVGFVDDNVQKLGLRIHGMPVLGTRHDIPRLVGELEIDEVIIAMPSAPGKIIRVIAQLCESVGVSYKTMPSIYELLSGNVSVNRLREVEIDDLLRREPVEVDEPGINSYLSDKRVLITGAGGSIGSELTRQVARYGPAQLILLGHGENSIYAISQEMQNAFLDLDIQPCIADIRDAQRIEYLFRRYQPQVVFHAAAHKHVPLMEINPCEAVANNIIGTQVILEAARQAQVERLVLISSDKAVDPTNVMGATKRIAELLVQEMAQRVRDGAGSKPAPTYVAVRFGNVLGSRGSVVPLFKQQIAQGGPITITHPEMERFFMTIPEAVHLVIQAAALGRGGEIFVLDMGQPVKIVDLARDLIELSGLKPGEDIDIVFTGLRPGEKLTEELFSKREITRPTTHPKITAIAHAAGEDDCQVQEAVMAFKQAVSRQDEGQIYTILANLLPEAKLQEMPPITHRQSSLSL